MLIFLTLFLFSLVIFIFALVFPDHVRYCARKKISDMFNYYKNQGYDSCKIKDGLLITFCSEKNVPLKLKLESLIADKKFYEKEINRLMDSYYYKISYIINKPSEKKPEEKPKEIVRINNYPYWNDDLNKVPEAIVKQTFCRLLSEKYGYKAKDIVMEFCLRIGSSNPRPDIVVFYNTGNQSQDNIFLIVETKRHNSGTSYKNTYYQLHSYISAIGSCKYGALVIGKKIEFFKCIMTSRGTPDLQKINDIPYFYSEINSLNDLSEKVCIKKESAENVS